jgi:hypothetical protein
MLFRRALFAALLLASAIAAGAGAAIAGQPARFGALQVEQVSKAGDPGAERLHLRWRSADGQAWLYLIDDGETMRADVDARDCRVTIHYQKYDGRPGEPRLRRRLLDAVGSMARYCTRLPERERAAWRSEYETAETDFPAAIEEMKRQAYYLFGDDMKRCRQPRVNRSIRTMLRCERRN